jgi:signal peptidase I
VRKIKTGLTWLSNLVPVLAVVTFLGLAVGPHLLGYRTEAMLTGSMAPKIKVGDITVVTLTPVDRIVPGGHGQLPDPDR